jgi:WD40 repeat protein
LSSSVLSIVFERIQMIKSSIIKTIILALVVLLLAGCALPSMTPPPEYGMTAAPTTTAPVPGTEVSPTAAPAIVPQQITTANAAGLIAANKIPVSNVQSLTWSMDGSILGVVTQNIDASGTSVYSAVLLDGSTLATKALFSPTDGRIDAICPDGHLAAVISNDFSTLNIYDMTDGNRNIISLTPQYTLYSAAFSPDGKYFSLSSNDAWQVEIHSLPSGELVTTLTGFETAAPVYDAGFRGADGTILWRARATLQLQDMSTGTMGTIVSGEDFFGDYTLSADGSILAGTAAKTIDNNDVNAITLWNAADGSELKTIVLPDVASAITFSPDASMLAVTVSSNVLVYEVSTGNLLATLSGHSGSSREVAFSPDGLSLVSSGEDNQLILWQVPQ